MSRPAAALLAWPLLTALLLAGLSGPHDDGQLDTRAPAPPLEAGRVLEQRFTAVADRLTAVELVLANYAKAADGRLLVAVVDLGGAHGSGVADEAGGGAGPEGRALATWEIQCASVADNVWRRFELPTPATGIEGHLLALRVARPEAGGNPVTVWTSGGDAWPGTEARFDGAPLPGDLALRLRYEPPRTQAVASRFRRIGLAPASGMLLVAGLAFGAVLTMAALWSVPDLSPPGLPPDLPDPMPPAATGPG